MRRAFLALCAAIVAGLTHAQDCPVQPVRIVIPYAPGGGTDILARLVGKFMEDMLIDIVHIAYKGAGPAVLALLAKEVDIHFATPAE